MSESTSVKYRRRENSIGDPRGAFASYDVLVDGEYVGNVRRTEERIPVYAGGGRLNYVAGYRVRKVWTWDAIVGGRTSRSNFGRCRCYANNRSIATERLLRDAAAMAND